MKTWVLWIAGLAPFLMIVVPGLATDRMGYENRLDNPWNAESHTCTGMGPIPYWINMNEMLV